MRCCLSDRSGRRPDRGFPRANWRLPPPISRPSERGDGGGRSGHLRPDRPPVAGLRELRRLPRLRGARRALPRSGPGARRMSPAKQPKKPAPKRKPTKKGKKKTAQPIEYSLLLTATLCLLALGVVMVFSASSTTSLLGESGDGAYYLKRTLLYGVVGLLALKFLASGGLKVLRPLAITLMALALFLLRAVMIAGGGTEVHGAE